MSEIEMGSFGTTEIILILIVGFLLLGSKGVIKLAKSLGQIFAELTKIRDELMESVNEVRDDFDEVVTTVVDEPKKIINEVQDYPNAIVKDDIKETKKSGNTAKKNKK